MNQSYFRQRVRELSGVQGISQEAVDAIVGGLFQLIREEVARNGHICFTRLGSFQVRVRGPRTGTDLRGRPWRVPLRKVIRFRPSKRFLEEVRNAG